MSRASLEGHLGKQMVQVPHKPRAFIDDYDYSQRLGFAKRSRLDKHMRVYHPQSGRFVDIFTKLKMGRKQKESNGLASELVKQV